MTRQIVSTTSIVLVSCILSAGGLSSVCRADVPTSISAPNAATAPAQAPQPIIRPLRVVVSIPPLKGLIEPLLPPGSRVDVLIPPGVSEHGYEIPPAKLAAILNADLVVSVGMGMEPQVEKALAGSAGEGRTAVKFEDVPAVKAARKPVSKCTHDHDDHDHDHDHADAADPHVWLDPVMALALSEHVGRLICVGQMPVEATDAQVKAYIASRKDYERHFNRIKAIDERLKSVAGSAQRRTIVVAHDAYGWLAQRYGISVVPISGLNAGEPRPADMKKAAEAIKEHGLTTVFVEPQLSPAAANRIAQMTGAKVDTLDPLGSGDWFEMMNKNIAALERAMGREPARTAGDDKKAKPAGDAPSPASKPGEKPTDKPADKAPTRR